MKPDPDYSLYLVTDAALAGPRGVEAVVKAAVAGGVAKRGPAPFPHS